MSTFSHKLDLREIAEEVEKSIGRVGLIDKLFLFANLDRSPEPAELVKEAVEAIRKYPLSSLFGTSHLDREGKVIHRTQSGGFGEDADDSAVRQRIAQSETIRRQVTALGQIEVARQAIVNEHFLSDDVFASLLQHSPFVPPYLVATFCRRNCSLLSGRFRERYLHFDTSFGEPLAACFEGE